jgi:hypothetical protein
MKCKTGHSPLTRREHMAKVRINITREDGELLDTIILTDGYSHRLPTIEREKASENKLSHKIIDSLERHFNFQNTLKCILPWFLIAALFTPSFPDYQGEDFTDTGVGCTDDCLEPAIEEEI